MRPLAIPYTSQFWLPQTRFLMYVYFLAECDVLDLADKIGYTVHLYNNDSLSRDITALDSRQGRFLAAAMFWNVVTSPCIL